MRSVFVFGLFLCVCVVSITAATGCGGGGGGTGGGSTTIAPAISSQPIDRTAVIGGTVSFAVVASGTSPAYQWRHVAADSTDTAMSGKVSSNITIPVVAASDAGSYYVVVSNSAGTVTSRRATLTIGPGSGGSVVTVN